jgi:AcrR family transcriptional regulator
MISEQDGTRPRQGTRPRNRRALILAAASELFSAEGYPRVSMEDIATAVAVSPSALYRHVRGKRQLLTEVVLDAFASIRVQFTVPAVAAVSLTLAQSAI